MNSKHPFHPIIYVRGFAATPREIDDAVADPYMGFNLGATKMRMAWTGELRKFFFESPLLRLATEHQYEDAFLHGEDLTAAADHDQTVPRYPDIALPYRSVVIYRYYDEASDAFGKGKTPTVEHFARGLSDLILRLRTLLCRAGTNPHNGEHLHNGIAPEDFRVYLVAHSMGGLICRAFLQNPRLGSDDARKAVNKLFTYATPHNGIDVRGIGNVPGWFSFGDADNFNRKRIADYLGMAATDDLTDVAVVTSFPPERVFNLVGTNPADYAVFSGLSSWAAGEQSDGLVRIDNAVTHGPGRDGADVSSPRAFVHRSHSGHFGIVNSEEGYQNLTRFLFGALRADGVLDVDEITLPVEVQRAKDKGKRVRASYQFEVALGVRGGQWQLHRREAREQSAIFRRYDELFPEDADGRRHPDRRQSPHLFSVFLDPSRSTRGDDSVSFAFDLAVLVPDYEIDGNVFTRTHYEGGCIYRSTIVVEARPDPDVPASVPWRIRYALQYGNKKTPMRLADTRVLADNRTLEFTIPVETSQRPGIRAALRVAVQPWS